jgi:hypothetical protein
MQKGKTDERRGGKERERKQPERMQQLEAVFLVNAE